MKKLFKILILSFLLAANAHGATYYVRDGATGDGTGTGMTEAASAAYFEAGTGVFGDQDNDIVCFSGAG